MNHDKYNIAEPYLLMYICGSIDTYSMPYCISSKEIVLFPNKFTSKVMAFYKKILIR